MKITKIVPHKFYPWQSYCWQNLRQNNVIVVARQHGKTYFMTQVIRSIATLKPNSQIVLLCDTVKRLYKLYNTDFKAAFGHDPNFNWPNDDTSALKVSAVSGGTSDIFLYGTEKNPLGVKGTHPDLIVMDESGLNHPDTILEGAAPATDKSGGMIICTGTVENNWYYDHWLKANKKIREGNPHWFAFNLKMYDKWSRQVHNPEAIKKIEAKYDRSNRHEDQVFRKDYLNDWFATGDDSPYRRAIGDIYEQGRLTVVPRQPDLKVGITFDNGLGCTAIWLWQVVHKIPRFLKYMEWRNESLHTITKDIMDVVKNQWKTELGCMVIPHTMNERIQSTPDLSTFTQIYCRLLNFQGKKIHIAKVGSVNIKEHATSELLKLAIFDEVGCAHGIRCVASYRRNMKKKDKDEYSHAVDSLGEFALAWVRGNILASEGHLMYNNPIEDYFKMKHYDDHSILNPY